MHNYHDIIKAPVVTEKSNMLAEAGKYVFLVDVNANKTNVKQAIEAIFNVKVASVNIMNTAQKLKGRGRHKGLTRQERKAIVTLKEGQTIDLG